MEEMNWVLEMQSEDRGLPLEDLQGDLQYVVHRNEFAQVPDVNFVEIALLDEHVRVLLN